MAGRNPARRQRRSREDLLRQADDPDYLPEGQRPPGGIEFRMEPQVQGLDVEDLPEFTREDVYVLPTINTEVEGETLRAARLIITPELVAIALYEARGMVSVAARKLNCSIRVINRFVRDHDICRVAVEEADAMLLDFAEGKLLQKIKAGDIASIIFYLRTKGKTRGYTEKQLENVESNEQMQEVAKREAAERETAILERMTSMQARLSTNLGFDIILAEEEVNEPEPVSE